MTRRSILSRFVRRSSAGALIALVALTFAEGASAATCASVASLEFTDARIISSGAVYAGSFAPPPVSDAVSRNADYSRLPSFCRVVATLTPSGDSDIRIEVWMPASGWNGRFQALGNGGWAGRIAYNELAAAILSGYAAAATDAGHTGNSGAFAIGHPEKVVDMAYRAVHEMTTHAKAIVNAYYETHPTLSVWNSCSTGGRQGVVEASRYPDDFDAVVAGAPAVDWMRLHIGRIALHQSTRRNGQPVPPSKYPLLHAAVLASCDGHDGVLDGVLENPAACRFDPGVLQCEGADTSRCLTPAEVESARAFYEPVRRSDGAIVMSGLERGSELGWGTVGGVEPLGIALDGLRYVVHEDPAWDWRTFDLETDLARGDLADPGGALGAAAPDLSAFFERGGRLLMYHGWSDPQVPPENTIRFWNALVERHGRDVAGRSVQLYMVPGMTHCGGGSGTDRFNMLAAMEEWTALGRAPDRIPAARVINGSVERMRPLCRYPEVARYVGAGSVNDAASFVCAAP